MSELLESATFIDRLSYGGQVTLLGMGIVFSVLIIIWFFLIPFKYIFTPRTKKPAPLSETPVAPVPRADVRPESVTPAPVNDCEIVAAIISAIASGEGKAVKIVSISPRSSTAWSKQ